MSKNKSRPMDGSAHIVLLIVVIALAGFIGTTNISTTKEFPQSFAFQNVLGEDETEKKEEEKDKEDNKKSEEQQKETQKVKEETRTEGKKSETKIETADGKKIKTKVEDDGTTKIEIEHGQLKLKYTVENGQLRLKAENEQGDEVELEDSEIDEMENEIENEFEKDDVEIATGSDKPIFVKNNMAAFTDFPLSIDVGTNQLIVTTPSGQKVVTVLPDQAVQNLLATKVINKIEQASDTDLTTDLDTLEGVVKLEVRNDEVVYRIKGAKTHNLLGFIPVDTETTVFVSTDTGQPIAQEQTIIANIIDFLSP